MKRTLKLTACLCAAVMSMSAMSALCYAEAAPAEQTAVTAQADKKAPKAANVKLGKVTAVNGSEITVALGEFAKKQKSGETDTAKEKSAVKPEKKTDGTADSSDSSKPAKTAKPAKPAKTENADNTEKAEKTEKAGSADKRFGMHGRKGASDGEFTENGSTATVTLSENNTFGKDGKAVSAADIAVGDLITLEYNDDGELTGVRVMKAQTGKAECRNVTGEKGTKEKSSKDRTARRNVKTEAEQSAQA